MSLSESVEYGLCCRRKVHLVSKADRVYLESFLGFYYYVFSAFDLFLATKFYCSSLQMRLANTCLLKDC